MDRRIVPTTLLTIVALATAAVPARAQEDRLALGPGASATVAAVESEGATHPRPDRVMSYPGYAVPPDIEAELRERLGPPPERVGGPERRCVLVPEVDSGQPKVVRSGEFVIGGDLGEVQSGKTTKLWRRPLADASMEMDLQVRGWRIDDAGETARFEIGPPTASLDSETLEPYADEAGFPGGVFFPSPGTWIVVGSTGRSWGCFLFSVP